MCLCNRCMVGIVMIFEHRNLSLCVGERALPSLLIHTQWSTVPALVFCFIIYLGELGGYNIRTYEERSINFDSVFV